MSYEETMAKQEQDVRTLQRYRMLKNHVLEQNKHHHVETIEVLCKFIVDSCEANQQPIPFGVD